MRLRASVITTTPVPAAERDGGYPEGEYEDLRVVMVGIDGQDDPEKVREFVERYDIESPAVYQPSLGPTYQVSGYPTTYVLDGEGEIVAAHSGEAPREVYEGWIEEALGTGS